MDDGQFCCHPACLDRSYWRRLFVEVEEEIRGVRPGQFVEMVLAVEHAENERDLADGRADRPATVTGRKATVELYLRGWPEGTIDETFGYPAGATARVVERSRVHPRGRDVVAAHLQGDPPSRISRECDVHLSTVLGILESIGEEPHRVRDAEASRETNRAVARRYGEGWSYRRIAEDVGITETLVRSRLEYLRRTGRLGLPPRPRSNVRPGAQHGPGSSARDS